MDDGAARGSPCCPVVVVRQKPLSAASQRRTHWRMTLLATNSSLPSSLGKVHVLLEQSRIFHSLRARFPLCSNRLRLDKPGRQGGISLDLAARDPRSGNPGDLEGRRMELTWNALVGKRPRVGLTAPANQTAPRVSLPTHRLLSFQPRHGPEQDFCNFWGCCP